MGDISLWGWMTSAVLFALGSAGGYFIARLAKDQRTVELEQELKSTRSELNGYQGDVNRHFLKTSLLLGKLTDNYREVYEHLATGAQKLCAETPNTPTLNLPDISILPPADTDEHEADYPAVSPAQPIEQPVESMDENIAENTTESATESNDEKVTEDNTEDAGDDVTDSSEPTTAPNDAPTEEQMDAEQEQQPPQEKHDEDSPLEVESSVKLKSQ
ncbi:MAG: DUF1043 family protein [Gammaproteobacteria bacterium]|nr:DUF1043 family protein [Gammaproteobacteria bacterium]